MISKTPSRGLIAIATALLCVSCTPQDDWERIDRDLANSPVGTDLREALIVGPDLWLRTYSTIIRYRMSDWTPLEVGHDVVDAAAAPQGLWVLRAPIASRRDHDKPGIYRVGLWNGSEWFQSDSMRHDETNFPVAIVHSSSGPVVVSQTALDIFNSDLTHSQRVPLQSSIGIEFVDAASSALIDGDWLYLSFALGEWGGGVRRIELATGKVEGIQQRGTSITCTGPLDPQCDPVSAMIVSPSRPQCIEAAVDQGHGYERGHLVQVCDGTPTVLFERPKNRLGDRLTAYLNFGRGPFGSEGFSSLSADAQGYWALSSRNAYRFENGWVTRHALPRLRHVSGIAVSNGLQGKLIVAAHPDPRFARIFAERWTAQ